MGLEMLQAPRTIIHHRNLRVSLAQNLNPLDPKTPNLASPKSPEACESVELFACLGDGRVERDT